MIKELFNPVVVLSDWSNQNKKRKKMSPITLIAAIIMIAISMSQVTQINGKEHTL